MLVELAVRDLGVVEAVSIPFGPGLTALTGETGAGKTLLVEALAAVLGGRVGAGAVRSGAEEAVVEARFEVSGAEETILGRSVPVRGRTRCWIDGRMATVAVLNEQGADLVDIHGQHEQQSLLSAAGQRRALDAFAGLDDGEVRRGRRALRQLEREIEELGGSPEARQRQAELLRYQAEEIEAAQLDEPDEEESLAGEAEQLADVAAHQEAIRAALQLLGGGHLPGLDDEAGGALERIAAAGHALGGRPALGAWRERLAAAAAEVDDVAADLRGGLEHLEEDPGRLEEVQHRRRLLQDLRRKYGGDLAEVIAAGQRARDELAELEAAGERLADLRARRDGEAERLRHSEEALRGARHEAARRLAESVDDRLHDLAMPGATLDVEVSEDGAGDDVRFLLAANPGEPPAPLSQVASGGELARSTLALRLMTLDGPPTVLFDEVDAGVGGEAALALAAALAELAGRCQVLVVTHLAQVAAFADHHVVVRKVVREGRTLTEAEAVEGDQRVVELSRMLSGHPDSPTARAHAAELMARGREATQSTSRSAARR